VRPPARLARVLVRTLPPLLLWALLLPGGAGGAETEGLFQLSETHVDDRVLGVDPALDPYDPSQVVVDALITAPIGGVVQQPLFWMVPQERFEQQGYSSEQAANVPWERFRAVGAGTWCLRFAPSRLGTWRWSYRVRQGAAAARLVAGGTLQALAAGASSGGIVQDAQGNLACMDQRPFIPVGTNVAWPNEGGSAMFAHYLDALSAVGGNAVRVWLVHYYGGTALEWSHNDMNAGYSGVGCFSQESAARVDRLLTLAENHHIKLLLSLWTFGDCSFDWANNPYAHSAGGWLEEPGQFFTDARALTAQRNLLRYEVARWGAYPALWGWELWNEVDNCTGYNEAAVGQWHVLMAHELHGLDTQHHPITTSYRFNPPLCACTGNAAPDLTLVQSHTYWPSLVSAIGHDCAAQSRFGKPWFLGEYGMSDDPAALAADAQGWHVHDGLWGSLMSGSVGAGFSWWWDSYLEAHGLWPHFRGIALFTAHESLTGLVPCSASADSPHTAVLARASSTRLWAWARDLRAIHTSGRGLALKVLAYGPEDGPRARTLSVRGLHDGRWLVTWWDPYDGTWMAAGAATASGGVLTLSIPAYRNDIALKAELGGALQPPAPPAVPPTPWHDALLQAWSALP